MYQNHRIGALLLMGGVGLRFGGPCPKQFCLLEGKPIYLHALETLLKSDLFDEILIVCHPAWFQQIQMISPLVKIVAGGETRQESAWAGIKAFSIPPEIVLIHDAVRPFVTEKMLLENIQAALSVGAADTCIPSSDTLVFVPNGKEIASIPKRNDFLRGQTPQTFRYDLILQAHERAQREGIHGMSDDCSLVSALGLPIAIVSGSEKNIKITTEFDLTIASCISSSIVF